MTISSETRRAGPYHGNGVTTSFAFTFKVFDEDEVVATLLDTDTDEESTLVLDSDYSVALNADQNASPGGTVTYPLSGSPMAAAYDLTLSSAVTNTQETDITNGGGFYPEVFENALDRLTILVQQLAEQLDRTLRVPISFDDTLTDLQFPDALKYLRWNALATGLEAVELASLGVLALPVSVADGGTGATTASAARTALGLAIGTNVQAYDADLTTLGAGGASARTFLGLALGSDVQAYNAALADLASLGASVVAGDLIIGSGANDFGRLAKGSALQQLRMNSGATALEYFTATAAGLTLATPVATTSGTAYNFTGIPAGTKMIACFYNAHSMSGTDHSVIQIGDSGGLETSGYLNADGQTNDAPAAHTTGFFVKNGTGSGACAMSGVVMLYLINAATFTWVAHGLVYLSDSTKAIHTLGIKSLSAELDRVGYLFSGTDTGDAGAVSIAYM